ncbi:hypothetical protein EYF80_006370 [Liparis tanakae]|uniref:Uncharacterized protein n=1 Tax=Liparis tanakae TaxID=230148 RepID=A0A4Z2IZG0_9TELE|nr:hypothetical protein EYF80_006370 [Liparis tanakae]
MEAHWRVNTLHRELDQVSSRFQMCSRTVELCRGKTERQVREMHQKPTLCLAGTEAYWDDQFKLAFMPTHNGRPVRVWRKRADCVLQCLTVFTCQAEVRPLGEVRVFPSVTNEVLRRSQRAAMFLRLHQVPSDSMARPRPGAETNRCLTPLHT